MLIRQDAFIRLLAIALLVSFTVPAFAQREVKDRSEMRSRRAGSATDFAAKRLLKKGQDLLLIGEQDRGVKMLQAVVEQYPDSNIRYEAWLVLGRYHIEIFQQPQGIIYLAKLRDLEKMENLKGESKEQFLESLYLTGMAYFQTKQFSKAFPVLRKITTKYQDTSWANQAYYYIGMCHFAQGNWNKAIEALNLVGTYIDPNSPEVEFAEAGRRFYVKIEDGDLPVLESLGQPIKLVLKTDSGDEEKVDAAALPGKQTLYISSTASEIGPAEPNDGKLQVRGHDRVLVTYYDDNTKAGEKDLPREKEVQVVSTGSVSFTHATYETNAEHAFLNAPLFVLVQDADLDTSEGAENVEVRVICRYRVKTEESEADAKAKADESEFGVRESDNVDKYKIRDEVTFSLSELGEESPIHSGKFGGDIEIKRFNRDTSIDKADKVLAAAVDDEIIVSYVDHLHINGRSSRQATAKVVVAGELNTNVIARQNVVSDAVMKAKKNIVEATALLELARLFNSMGLREGGGEKSDEGLGRVDPIIKVSLPIPASLKQEAFKLKWELYLAQDQFSKAIETCRLFNRLYPESPFVDRALMGIGHTRMAKKEYDEATAVFKQVLGLTVSQAKGEAQYHIGYAIEMRAREHADESPEIEFSLKDCEGAIQAYKTCSEKYPDSPFAGPSLSKQIDYYMETRDHIQADDLLEQVFDKYPDSEFLDEMLLKWVKVSFRMGNIQKAHEKCEQLIFEYPGSIHAEAAKKIMPLLEKKLGIDKEPDPKDTAAAG